MLIYNNLKKSTIKYPQKIALSYNNNTITYSNLKVKVDKLALNLQKMGIKPDVGAGLYLHNSIDFVICLYALSKINVITCLLNPHLDSEIVIKKLNSAKVDFIITESYLYKKLLTVIPDLDNKFKLIIRNGNKNSLKELMKTGVTISDEKKDDIFDLNKDTLIQSSSGTTGLSKMSYRTHKNLSIDTDSIIATLNYNYKDRIYCPMPLCHGYGLTMGLLAPIKSAATIHIERWFMANRFFSDYESFKPTIIIADPPVYEIMADHPGDMISKLKHTRLFLCSGSSLFQDIGETFFGVFGVWLNQVYGMMEASTISVNLLPNKENFLSVGKPVKNVQIRIDKSVGSGKLGEILVRSGALSNGYLNSGKRKKLNYDGQWFRTGDIGSQDLDENLFIVGRKK